MESLLADEQAGFRTGRSTVEQILNVRILCEKYIEHGRELNHNFIDFKKAFDWVWHEGLWVVMRKHNISDDVIRGIQGLYARSECSVLIGDTMSDKFSQSIGVRQGCSLSPCLFNLFLDKIMTETPENFEGTVSLGSRRITNLRFADDIDFVAGSRKELADLTARLDDASTAYGMEISAEKSKVLAMGTTAPQQAITIRSGKLGEVHYEKYMPSDTSELQSPKTAGHWSKSDPK